MNEALRSRYVQDLVLDLEQVGGARLEKWLRPLWDHLAGAPVNARGLNLEGSPVAGALDAIWPDGSVAEASSLATYFDPPYDKVKGDVRHALEEIPGVRTIRLFCTRVAGPRASMVAERARRRLARRGYVIDVWDGKRIAEYIVDTMLVDERYVERVGDALPNLRRIHEQNAASARVPALDIYYRSRAEEDLLVARLESERSVVLAGLGGIGKTELACAVAHRLRQKFELEIWVEGERATSLESLRAFDVRLNGYKLNLLNLLADHKTLLILDNVKGDLDQAALAGACGPHSRVLITSQVAFGNTVEPLEFVGRELARTILSDGIVEACPEEVLETVLGAVEGHPLVLRLLNRVARQGGWPAVVRQCPHMAGAPDANRRTVAARILEQHLDVLGPELACFAWCETGSVDRGFFESVFGPGAVETLGRWALTARGQSDAVRLHDLVYASVERLREKLPINSTRLQGQLEGYLESQLAPKRLGFFRVVNRHRELVRKVLSAQPRPGAIRYAYLHGHQPSHLEARLIGDPAKDAAVGPNDRPNIWALSIVEAIESDYRRVRDLGGKTEAKATLEERLPVFDCLIDLPGIPAEARSIVRHHRAKSLLKLGRVNEALQGFEALIDDRAVQHPVKLQIARLSEADPERAKRLIFEIIEAERDNPGSVSTSVLIETLGTLRRKHLRRVVREMTDRYGRFMAQQIKAAACSGEDQPIRAFASVGPEWSYIEPELFMDVLEDMDLGAPSDAEDDDERVAIGRLLTAAGKRHLRVNETAEARRRFEQAVTFYEGVGRKSGFSCTHHADALLCLRRPAEAERVLEEAPASQREAFWLLRHSEADLALGRKEQSLDRIDEALAILQLPEFKPTFLAHRSDVLFALGNPAHEQALREAIQLSADPSYKAQLQSRLAARLLRPAESSGAVTI